MKKRMWLYAVGICGLLVLFVIRVWQVNQNAKFPEIQEIPQGESAEYRGLEYTVVSATLWDSADFFLQNEQLAEYQSAEIPPEDIKLLLVSYRIEKRTDENRLDLYIPIQYAHLFNGVDVYMAQAMNPSVADGSFTSGDVITIPYEIYKSNLTETQWEDVEALRMEYETVLGTYPVKIQMQIDTIQKPQAGENGRLSDKNFTGCAFDRRQEL